MAKTIEQLINESNKRLKAGKTGLTIELRSNKLSLRGLLPPKQDSIKVEPFTQRIPLGYLGNPAGIQRAEADALQISGQLIQEKFDWTKFIEVWSPERASIAELLQNLKVEYCTRNSETSWNNYWLIAYKWLPQDEQLSVNAITSVLLRYAKETRSRQMTFNAISVLVNFAKFEISLDSYRSTYARSSLNPRDIPSDEEIAKWYKKIANSHWRWAYGMFATYGLRNHEIFNLELCFPNVRVLEGKTGTRLVFPLHPEWVNTFKLEEAILPKSDRALHKSQGETVTRYFGRIKLPFKIYSLRHAWAIRNIGYGIPDTVSAKAMGHGLQVHTQTYQRWMSERDMEAVVSRAIANPQRPLPPS